ncbi:MAG: preprotein translocase subunit YajC [Ignavibacteriaceae bacterium]|nr:preprotein translocase subunit YajC [Ignavibacteriaceae bacterium]
MENIIILFQAGGTEQLLSTILPFLLIILVFYFLILRPQQKRQKEQQQMLDSVEKGNKVVTNGGLHGTVEGLDGSILIVKIADNVKVKIEKSAIANIVGVTDKK